MVVRWVQQTIGAIPAPGQPDDHCGVVVDMEAQGHALADAATAWCAGLGTPAYDDATVPERHRLVAQVLTAAKPSVLAALAGLDEAPEDVVRITATGVLHRRSELADVLAAEAVRLQTV